MGETAVDNKLNTLVKAVGQGKLTDVLKGAGPFTVFAPTDEAFAIKYPNGIDTISEKDTADLLKFHVIKGVVPAAAVSTGKVDTLKETGTPPVAVKLSITKTEAGDVTVGSNNANVTEPDVFTWNGVVHVVDAVLEEDRFLTMV